MFKTIKLSGDKVNKRLEFFKFELKKAYDDIIDGKRSVDYFNCVNVFKQEYTVGSSCFQTVIRYHSQDKRFQISRHLSGIFDVDTYGLNVEIDDITIHPSFTGSTYLDANKYEIMFDILASELLASEKVLEHILDHNANLHNLVTTNMAK